jgi:hypothetical protein
LLIRTPHSSKTVNPEEAGACRRDALTGVVPRAVLARSRSRRDLISTRCPGGHYEEFVKAISPDGDKRARILEDPEVLQKRQFDGGKNIFRMPRPMAAM